jgi:hypothetical protein
MNDERRGGDIMIARYVPPVSVPDMQRMAEAVVESGLFGMRTVPQALTLMWLAQAEGRHPVLAARDYHIIEGKPSKTAEAMMRDFLASGGSVEWHRLDDGAADATFSHPRGGEVRITWDMERAAQAGLLGRKNDMWKKYPRQMLRSRTVSEGIRTVGPMATSGLYVPEEAGDYEPRRPRMKDVTPQPPEEPPYDPDTGEIRERPEPEPMRSKQSIDLDRARRMAEKGTDIFRGWLQDLSREDRAGLRDNIGTPDQPGELLQLALQADAEALAERLRTESPGDGSPQTRTQKRPVAAAGKTSPGDKPGAYHVTRQGDTSDDWTAWELALHAMIDAGDDPAGLLRDNKTDLDIFAEVDQMRHHALTRALGVH